MILYLAPGIASYPGLVSHRSYISMQWCSVRVPVSSAKAFLVLSASSCSAAGLCNCCQYDLLMGFSYINIPNLYCHAAGDHCNN